EITEFVHLRFGPAKRSHRAYGKHFDRSSRALSHTQIEADLTLQIIRLLQHELPDFRGRIWVTACRHAHLLFPKLRAFDQIKASRWAGNLLLPIGDRNSRRDFVPPRLV